MAKRHRNALDIQEGACNPSGIAISIVDACQEVREENSTPTKDAAVRLMVHQLAHICGTDAINSGMDEYSKLTTECHLKAGDNYKTVTGQWVRIQEGD